MNAATGPVARFSVRDDKEIPQNCYDGVASGHLL